jgi:hypothetical protein
METKMAPDLEKLLADYERAADAVGSCGDGGCLVKRPVGMHTNGGCRCWTNKMKAQRMMAAGQRLYLALKSTGEEELPPNYAACCASTNIAACDCVNKQHIRVLFAKGGRKYQPTGGSL